MPGVSSFDPFMTRKTGAFKYLGDAKAMRDCLQENYSRGLPKGHEISLHKVKLEGSLMHGRFGRWPFYAGERVTFLEEI